MSVLRAIASYFAPLKFRARAIREENGVRYILGDSDIRQVLDHTKCGPQAIKQASYSAHDLETERENYRGAP